MADISITAASVLAGTGAQITHGLAGATITAGQVVSRDSAGSFVLADSNSATAAVREPDGIALNGASSGQPLAVITEGDLTLNAVLTAGIAYYLSSDPGGIAPVADVGAGEYPTILGIASSTTVLKVKIQQAGVAV